MLKPILALSCWDDSSHPFMVISGMGFMVIYHNTFPTLAQELDKSQLIWAALSDSNVKICMAGVTCALMVGTLRGTWGGNEGSLQSVLTFVFLKI